MARQWWFGSARAVSIAAVLAIGACRDDSAGIVLHDLVITTASTGPDIAPDGYLVVVESIGTRTIEPSGTVTFENVPEGSYVVELTDIPTNCTLAGANPRTVVAGSGDALAGRFEVTCVANVGTVEVTTASEGVAVPDDYTLVLGGTISRSVDANGVTIIEEVPAGPISVELMGLPANCSVAGDNPRTVTIPRDDRATTTFEVTCAPNVGGLQVVTSSDGGVDSDGYRVVVADTLIQDVDLNDQVTFSPVTPGDVAVHLTDVAAHCVVLGDNPRIVSVPFNETVATTFEIECDPTGDLEVNTSTTGMSIPGELTVSVAGAPDGSVGPSGTVVFPDLLAGDHSVALTGLPQHCEVVDGPNPRTVTVSGGLGSTSFEVTCWGWLVLDSHRTGNWDVVIMRHDGAQQTNLTEASGGQDRQPVVSPDGTKIAFASTRSGTEHIYVMNRDGTGVVQMTHTGEVNKEPSWSPHGSKIVFSRRQSSQWDVWMMDADDGSNQVNLTNNPAFDARGELSPDGTKLLFDSTRDGTRNIWVMSIDGTGVEQLTTDGGANATWSPDGSKITFTGIRPGEPVEIWIMNDDGTDQTNLTNTPASGDGESAWSPDGTTIAFASNRDGNFEIYFMDPDGTNPRRITFNASDDMFPSWSP